MSLKVHISSVFISWLLQMQGQGNVEILEPETLREKVLNIAENIININLREKAGTNIEN
jgi:hypothetical protein